jgi:hypothetical protein
MGENYALVINPGIYPTYLSVLKIFKELILTTVALGK